MKYDGDFAVTAGEKSLPTRERGLKSYGEIQIIRAMQSLPTRERGLKYHKTDLEKADASRSLHGSVD
ncbi:hypothetical protein [Caproicibacterium sp. XB2]|uniref:hypothetical protein n=1 Tax=Caproicibacterium sp. XB2 TaxID=3388458 RepID=UPI00384EACE8